MVRRLAVLVLAGCVLAGCGGAKEPKSDPTPSPVGSSPSSPSAAPTLPDAAKANTKAGAIAFVEFYIDAFNHAQATGDTSALNELGEPDCHSCSQITTSVTRIYKSGGHIEGGRWTVISTEIHKSVSDQWVIDVVGRFAPSKSFASASALPSVANGGPAAASFFVHHTSEWKVVRWTRAQ